MSPPHPRGIVRMPAVRRWTLRVAVLALIGAPLLANVWPALGHGPMLYVGETAALAQRARTVSFPRASQDVAARAESRAPGHAHRGTGHAHDDESRIAAPDGSNAGDPLAHAAHAEAATAEGAPAPTGESTASDAHAGHGVHCALCVLASLAWAPQVQLDAGQGGAVPILPPLPKPAMARRTDDPRTRVHARAPPALS